MTDIAVTAVARIAAFAAVLVAVFAVSVWLGGIAGPDPDVSAPHPEPTSEHLPSHGEAGR